MGTIGALGTGTVVANGPPGGNGPPGQSCGCSDGEFLAKYDFECVEKEDDECVDWDFVLTEGEDLIDITYIADGDGSEDYNKDGETAEPNYINFEAPGYFVQSVCTFGGNDTHSDEPEETEEGVYSFSSEPHYDNDNGEYDDETGLVNPGGQEAAISNITFCGEEVELEIPETVSLAYEDLPRDNAPYGGNDYDYNDFVVDIVAEANGGSDPGFESLSIAFTPKARGAGWTHEFSITNGGVLPDGDYDLEILDADGDEAHTDSGSFDDGETIDIFTGGFDSGAIFPDNETNAHPGDECVPPEYTATVEIDFDENWVPDVDELDFTEPHGEGLFFDPELYVNESPHDALIEVGDIRLLTVPTDWKWPAETTHIAEAYDDVGTEGDEPPANEVKPVFDEGWFDGGFDPDKVYHDCRV